MSHHKCEFCKTKKRTVGALAMHQQAKHPHEVQARTRAAMRTGRKARSHPFLAGMFGGVCGVLLLIATASFVAVKSQAVEVSPKGVTLAPWVVTVSVNGKR